MSEKMSFFGLGFSVHSDGLKFVGILGVVSLLLMSCSPAVGWVFVLLTILCVCFFRNPKRVVPNDPALVTSPADGTVCSILLESPGEELGIGTDERYKVSIFLSILDVHVNRIPASGTVVKVLYHPGAFINASLNKASIFNERNTVVVAMEYDKNKMIAFTQIAGMIARRIVCDVHEGQDVQKGAVFGLVRFGSRCDVWLPVGVVPQVIKGQRMVAGETIIADLDGGFSDLRNGTEL